MNAGNIQLFALSESRRFGEKVAAALGLPLGEHEERSFEDGEHKTRPLQNVRGRDVFVIQSLYSEGSEIDVKVDLRPINGRITPIRADDRVSAFFMSGGRAPESCYARGPCWSRFRAASATVHDGRVTP